MKNLLLLLGIAYGLMCIIKLFLWVSSVRNKFKFKKNTNLLHGILNRFVIKLIVIISDVLYNQNYG